MRPVVQLVVGVALLRDGRVLAARRARPDELAGGWELPGGKVEDGEDAASAAVREVAEELGCAIEVTGWLEGSTEVPSTVGPVSAASAPRAMSLRVATARLVEGDPVPSEHDAVRWLGPEELDSVRWLVADLPFLPALRARMGS